MRPRPAPQTAAQAREVIAEIRAAQSAKRAAAAIARFVVHDAAGLTNWTPEARTVWQEAAA
jgi:hypothetical protein